MGEKRGNGTIARSVIILLTVISVYHDTEFIIVAVLLCPIQLPWNKDSTLLARMQKLLCEILKSGSEIRDHGG